MTPNFEYETLDHTADTGIEVRATSREALFVGAAHALFAQMLDPDNIQPQQSAQIRIEAADIEELLVAWLRELLARFSADLELACRFEIEHLDDRSLTATVWGEPFDPDRHEVWTELKAITYHDLSIACSPEGQWTARVVFDV